MECAAAGKRSSSTVTKMPGLGVVQDVFALGAKADEPLQTRKDRHERVCEKEDAARQRSFA